MEFSRKQTVIIVGGVAAGAVGVGALLWMMSKPASAESTTTTTQQTDCSSHDMAPSSVPTMYKLDHKYHGVGVYKIVKKAVHTQSSTPNAPPTFVDCPECGYAAWIDSAGQPSAADVVLLHKWIDQACAGQVATWDAPKIYGAPLYLKTMGHAPPCECFNCGC